MPSKVLFFSFSCLTPPLCSQLLKGRDDAFFILCPSIFSVPSLEQTNYLVNEWNYMKFVY